MANAKKIVESLLKKAGITVNGGQPYDLQIHDERFYGRVLGKKSMGLGEAYMDGWWDCESLDQFFHKILSANLDQEFKFSFEALLVFLKGFLLNLQTSTKSFEVGERHYDIGNKLFQTMLDSRLTYSCGYWNPSTKSGLKRAKTLDDAQEDKLDLVCKKIGLKPAQTVLDIGCGWGSFAKYAAEKYGARVTGITVSKEQVALGKELCRGLPVELKLQDYRKINEKFDHIVSLGMFEHVGSKNYRTYMRVVASCLKDQGIFLLHTIGSNYFVRSADPWMAKYIFLNGMLPSIAQLGKAIEGLFVMEDWHNFSADYDKTLMAWFDNFNKGWKNLEKNYSMKFYRMWKYYLLSCAGSFRARRNQLWQIVLSKNGVPGGYSAIR